MIKKILALFTSISMLLSMAAVLPEGTFTDNLSIEAGALSFEPDVFEYTVRVLRHLANAALMSTGRSKTEY